MLKIGVIGDYESICGFSAIGFDTQIVKTREEAKVKFKMMVEKDYRIIYVTSDMFFEVNSDKVAVVPLPDRNSFLGTERIRRFTEKAAGSRL